MVHRSPKGLVLASLVTLLWAGCKAPASVPTPTPTPEPAILLFPLGDPDPVLVNVVKDTLEATFRVRVRTGTSAALPRAAWYEPRQRWRAEKLLTWLDTRDREGAWKVVAFTEEPISTTKGEHVDWGIAGLSDIDGPNGVLTSHVFRSRGGVPVTPRARTLFHQYVSRVALHEAGHTFGLEHCPIRRCLMSDFRGSAAGWASQSSGSFCPRCAHRLGVGLRQQPATVEWTAAEQATLRQIAITHGVPTVFSWGAPTKSH